MYVESDPRWSAPDGMSSEFETADYLYGLIRLIKPEIVLETGCYRGETTIKMAQALKANGCGKLVSCDTDESLVQHVRERLMGWPVDLGSAEIHHCKGVELIAKYPSPDIAFIDAGECKNRFAEVQALRMKQGGLVLLHDARRPSFHDVCSWYPHWSLTFFSTPRGLAMWQT